MGYIYLLLLVVQCEWQLAVAQVAITIVALTKLALSAPVGWPLTFDI